MTYDELNRRNARVVRPDVEMAAACRRLTVARRAMAKKKRFYEACEFQIANDEVERRASARRAEWVIYDCIPV